MRLGMVLTRWSSTAGKASWKQKRGLMLCLWFYRGKYFVYREEDRSIGDSIKDHCNLSMYEKEHPSSISRSISRPSPTRTGRKKAVIWAKTRSVNVPSLSLRSQQPSIPIKGSLNPSALNFTVLAKISLSWTKNLRWTILTSPMLYIRSASSSAPWCK